ncbi:unnamed protein product [Prorocentrum cordatum]|uniref:Treble clef zinc finger domain-containing protein n=1 Tax=Prorocentrum cordatum TaxID=2364126 RepID=A0ABN9P973_9DINO|nr:unnamed protein product [Polarella glacialis]
MQEVPALRRAGRPKLGLLAARQAAVSRGGQCLSRSYQDCMVPLKWQCSKGHQWSATLHSIRNGNSWCPHCAKNARPTLDDAIRAAVARGGLCLSTRYNDSRSALQWQCEHGHTFWMRLGGVRSEGKWCPSCVRASKDVQFLQLATHVATSRGGQCLGIACRSGLVVTWKCGKGHQWHARLNNVLKGTWCPSCSVARRRLSIEDAKAEAVRRGGACLSSYYTNSHSHLRWMCSEGHEWNTSLTAVKHGGSWCPVCQSGRSEREVRIILETIFVGHSFPRCRPLFLKGLRGVPLELDGYCQKLSIAFEYNGEQHYDPQSFWNLRRNSDAFDQQCLRDHRKTSLCAAAGIRLIVVPFYVKDRWAFIRLSLLRWFSIAEVNWTLVPAGQSRP